MTLSINQNEQFRGLNNALIFAQISSPAYREGALRPEGRSCARLTAKTEHNGVATYHNIVAYGDALIARLLDLKPGDYVIAEGPVAQNKNIVVKNFIHAAGSNTTAIHYINQVTLFGHIKSNILQLDEYTIFSFVTREEVDHKKVWTTTHDICLAGNLSHIAGSLSLHQPCLIRGMVQPDKRIFVESSKDLIPIGDHEHSARGVSV